MADKKRDTGFQKPLSQPGSQEVRIARISYPASNAVACSCGWVFAHLREKVREDAVDRHLAKRHNGKGFRF